jgi:cell shape-determining protein MreC
MIDAERPPMQRLSRQRRATRPAVVLAVALAAALVLAAGPAGWSRAVRGKVAQGLRPAQLAALAVERQFRELVGRVERHFQAVSRLSECEAERDTLRQENGRLAAELTTARKDLARPGRTAPGPAPEPLLRAGCVEAQVLGQQALAFLGRRHLLDVGQSSDVQPDALVVAGHRPALIDRGRDTGLKPGLLVLDDARVWGKIVEVGPATSVVRTVAEAGYRDLVRLVSPHGEPAALRRGPQGILEGTGQPQARVRLVEATEPVSVGDLVYTAADQGVLPEPLLYGRVVRAERPAGAAHWELWMEPAAAGSPPRVAVLRTEFNPARLVKQEP